MARRIDIELTSRRDDGTWTWRAPGARQPRGDVEGALVPSEAKVGDVLRAEAEFEIDGITVTAVHATRSDTRTSTLGRIEILGSGREQPAGVSVTLAPGGRRRRDDEDRPRRPRPQGEGREARSERPDRPDRPRRPARADSDRSEGARERRPGPGERRRGPDAARPTGRRPDSGDRPDDAGRSDRPARPDRSGRPRRAQPAATYRNAALAELRPEQIPVAEQLLRGGIPAVRQAIEEQNTRARAEGRGTVSAEPLLAMAEELLPKMNLATWKDRATAARAAGKDAPLREVRSVVAGASAATLDDEGRELLAALRTSLDTRVTALREAWLARITTALDEHRVAEALAVASRPPEPAARIPAEVAVRLATDAGAAMGPEVSEGDWTTLLEVVLSSPVRRTVKPAGLPHEPSETLLAAVRRAAGQVPELARLLGLPIPPPPGPRRPTAVGARRS
ncbi:MAG TPA: hypothetical protein VKR22_07285 [Acidimicrobiales bacterium]|nr:hypothetical protein [Acidimicrobiales bacterium]